jgi:hypothetical protein
MMKTYISEDRGSARSYEYAITPGTIGQAIAESSAGAISIQVEYDDAPFEIVCEGSNLPTERSEKWHPLRDQNGRRLSITTPGIYIVQDRPRWIQFRAADGPDVGVAHIYVEATRVKWAR